MKNVEIKLYLIAKTRLDQPEVARWLSDIGAADFEQPKDQPDGAKLIQLAAKRCYMAFIPEKLNPNVTRVRTDIVDYLNNILASSHGSVLEHVNFTFAIENVSRVFTAEMNRHRAGVAISEGSLRFIRFTDIPWWVPTSMRIEEDDDAITISKKVQTAIVFNRAFHQMEDNYKELEEIWDLIGVNAKSKAFSVKKKLTSMFRRIIGMGVATGGIWTLNVRALRHIITMRCDPAAEEEIMLVASTMLLMMKEAEPLLFSDFSSADGYWKPKYRKV